MKNIYMILFLETTHSIPFHNNPSTFLCCVFSNDKNDFYRIKRKYSYGTYTKLDFIYVYKIKHGLTINHAITIDNIRKILIVRCGTFLNDIKNQIKRISNYLRNRIDGDTIIPFYITLCKL